VSELNELRSEVARMRRAATRKISRIKQTHGAVVSGTEFDPRRAPGVHGGYTEKQLQAYRERLASFLSRSTQYVPDASARPLPRSEFAAYKAAEARYRESAGGVYEAIKHVELPSGETVEGRIAAMTPLHKVMHNSAMNRIFDPVERGADQITSLKSLRKLIRSLEKGSTPREIRRKVKESRDQMRQMLDAINEPSLQREVNKLTHNQYVALWNYTTFASAVSLAYESAKKMLSPKEEAWAQGRLRDQMGDAMEMIEWASRLPI
jgi:hypothetical protein